MIFLREVEFFFWEFNLLCDVFSEIFASSVELFPANVNQTLNLVLTELWSYRLDLLAIKILTVLEVVSIGGLTAFYAVFVPLEYIPSKPPHYTYVIVISLYFKKDWEGPQHFP